MKKIVAIISFVSFFLLSISSPKVAARSYDIDNYDVLVEIQEDGSAFFTERITYYFDGEFNGVLFNLDYASHPSPTDISVTVEGEGQAGELFRQATSQEPGTYELINEADFLRFTVYKPISDDEMTVVYAYRIPEMVTNYNDTAQFNRRVIGSAWDDVLSDVDVRIELPMPVEPGELKAWGHGDATGEVTLQDNQVVLLEVGRNPENTFVEANVVFPTYVTWNNPNKVAEDRLEQIIGTEEKLERDEIESRRNILIGGTLLGLFGPLVALLTLVWMQRKNKKSNPDPYDEPEYVYQLPAPLAPAVMNKAIFGQRPNPDTVTATLLDLVRRGYLKMDEIELENGFDYLISKTKESDTDLSDQEWHLLKWFLDTAGDGESVTLGEVEAIEADTKLGEAFYKEHLAWEKAVLKEAKTYEKRYQAPHAKAASIWVILSLIANIALLILLLTQLRWLLFLLGLTGLLLAIYGVVYYVMHPALTPEGDRAMKDWRAFKRMLTDVGTFSMADVGSVEMWDTYVVYAAAMGIADEVLDQMAIQYPNDTLYEDSYFYPYYYRNPAYLYGVREPISRGIVSSTPQSDSSSGSGGGFSGGSSGGSGGGSGGGAF
ncbi:DUF2207 domain-containing protein [Jeotgalibaca porci]|uniref:DUF2207 domain-containing protein n=1 Tax=Jeotgalibaca porci TaxID=1868793 RepID=A0A6G7WHT2_9LACT|nr:DUF2207 domain-containing protein [Jeotgalibaca porci]QIK51813.1 DUF2207 domain-containing protein [Jeotgalibaca porci]